MIAAPTRQRPPAYVRRYARYGCERAGRAIAHRVRARESAPLFKQQASAAMRATGCCTTLRSLRGSLPNNEHPGSRARRCISRAGAQPARAQYTGEMRLAGLERRRAGRRAAHGRVGPGRRVQRSYSCRAHRAVFRVLRFVFVLRTSARPISTSDMVLGSSPSTATTRIRRRATLVHRRLPTLQKGARRDSLDISVPGSRHERG